MNFKPLLRATLNLLLCFAAATLAFSQQSATAKGQPSKQSAPSTIEQLTARYEKAGREAYDRRQDIFKAAAVKPGAVVADIGAGTGLFTMMFAEAVGPKGKVIAVEIEKRLVEHIAKRAKEAGFANVETALCTERSVELPAGSADVVFLCDVYHHFNHAQDSMASIHRALRPGGEVVLVEFKRIPGKTKEWIVKHVRAGQEVFTAEIEAVGFKKVEEKDFMNENYFVRFRKVERK
ncbi:MAG: methyltransferase domain-containing protein [Verrucomicrobia bacterium]|nr:methyltransferase domain-containing protein [Verrucomicrobiota bacterium]